MWFGRDYSLERTHLSQRRLLAVAAGAGRSGRDSSPDTPDAAHLHPADLPVCAEGVGAAVARLPGTALAAAGAANAPAPVPRSRVSQADAARAARPHGGRAACRRACAGYFALDGLYTRRCLLAGKS